MTINDVRTLALADSGNIWRDVISDEFCERLGIPTSTLKPLNVQTVGTACKSGSMKVLGLVTKPLFLRVIGSKDLFTFRPVVIKDLSMAVNISKKFLTENGWDQMHSQNAVRINNKLFKLTAHNSGRVTGVYALHDTLLEPQALTEVNATHGDVVTDGNPECKFSGDAAILGPEADVYRVNAVRSHTGPGVDSVLVYNRNDEAVMIPKSTKLGEINAVVTNPAEPVRDSEVAFPMTKQEKVNNFFHSYVDYISSKPRKLKLAKQEVDPTKLAKPDQLKWAIDTFKLKDKPVLKKHPQLVQHAAELIVEYLDIFSINGSIGRTSLIEHEIITMENMPPQKTKQRGLPPGLEDDFRRHLDSWRAKGLISDSNSPWAANVLAVPKPAAYENMDAGIRYVVNFTRLNDVTKPDSFPLQSVDDVLSSIGGNAVFSSLDANSAFFVVPIKKEHREKTTTVVPGVATFMWNYMPFGLRNAPATFCRLIEAAMRDVPKSACSYYLDDLLVLGRTAAEHLNNLRLTFEAVRKSGLLLTPKKCDLFCDSVTFLGYKLDKDGIRPKPSSVEAISRWPMPTFKGQARAWLGFVGYYRKHCKDMAAMTKHWTDVVNKTTAEEEKKPLNITEPMRKEFELVKRTLTSPPVLGLPVFSGPKCGRFILETDFSAHQIGACLQQEQPDPANTVVISYASKKLNSAQQKYSSHKGELYALSFFCSYFRKFLQFAVHKFLVITDNKALVSLRRMDKQPSMIGRWLYNLDNYTFDIKHRPGVEHRSADWLSRHGHADGLSNEDDVDEMTACDINAILKPRGFDDDHLPKPVLLKAQEDDEVLHAVKSWVVHKCKPSTADLHRLPHAAQTYAKMLDRISLGSDGLLYFTPLSEISAFRRKLVILPDCLQEQAISVAHRLSGHSAAQKVCDRLLNSVYFASMARITHLFIAACEVCQQRDRNAVPQHHTYRNMKSGFAFQLVHIDIWGPLPNGSKTGSKYLLTCEDSFTRWIEAIPIKKADSETILAALEKEIFSRYGIPHYLFSDEGTNLRSVLMRQGCEFLGIKMMSTSSYHPQPNIVERMHRTLGQMLRATMNETGQDWEACLPAVLFAIRTASHKAIAVPPFLALFGRLPNTPLDILFGSPNPTQANSKPQQVLDMKARMDAIHKFTRQHMAKEVLRQRRVYNAEHKLLEVGNKVWLFTPVSQTVRKLSTYWTGPWIITNTDRDSAFVIIVPSDKLKVKRNVPLKVSIDRIKPYIEPKNPVQQDLVPADSLDGDEFVEFVRLYGQQHAAEAQPNVHPPPDPQALAADLGQAQPEHEAPQPDQEDPRRDHPDPPPEPPQPRRPAQPERRPPAPAQPRTIRRRSAGRPHPYSPAQPSTQPSGVYKSPDPSSLVDAHNIPQGRALRRSPAGRPSLTSPHGQTIAQQTSAELKRIRASLDQPTRRSRRETRPPERYGDPVNLDQLGAAARPLTDDDARIAQELETNMRRELLDPDVSMTQTSSTSEEDEWS